MFSREALIVLHCVLVLVKMFQKLLPDSRAPGAIEEPRGPRGLTLNLTLILAAESIFGQSLSVRVGEYRYGHGLCYLKSAKVSGWAYY